MIKRYYCCTAVLCLLTTIAFAQTNGGWTSLNASNAAKILYVSASDGNDSRGEVYLPSATSIGSDPFRPSGSVRPFRTVAAAVAQTSAGEAAWILLKRGDVFFESLEPRTGASPLRPFVYASYGSGNQPPLLKTGANAGISNCCGSLRNFWVVGLSFYAHTRNPNDSDYAGPAGSNGFRFYSGEGESTADILIEGCAFRFYESNVINGPGNYTNIKVRRNMFFDNYSVDGHSQGFYASNLNGLLLEGNIFDHNGWYRQQAVTRQNNKAGGQATMFNHNTYFADNHHVVFRQNSFYRPSSIGTKWTANQGPASTSDIEIVDNLYHDFELGISMGGNETEPPYRFKDITVTGNVFSNPNVSRPTNRSLGWIIDINDWDNGVCSNNYLLHQRQDNLGNSRGIRAEGQNRNLQIRGNILYNLKNSNYLEVVGNDFTSTEISDNEFTLPTTNEQYFVSSQSSSPRAVFEGNVYGQAEDFAEGFRVGDSRVGYAQWVSSVRESGATTTPPDYADPDRDVLTYVSRVLGLRSMEEFYRELRRQSYLNWREEYTTEAITRWIKAGYEPAGTSVPVQAVAIGNAPTTLEPGDQRTLSYTLRPADATNRTVRWSSSTPAVATVNAQGVLSARSKGNTTITVTTQDGNRTARFVLTVAEAPAGDNIALNKPVTVSSEPQPQNPGRHITDGIIGDGENRWSALGLPQSVVIDLKDTYRLEQTVLFPYKDRAYRYTIEVSTDGKTFTRVVDKSNNARGGNRLTDTFAATGRYIRWVISGASGYSGPWASLREIQVFGKLVQKRNNIALRKPVSASSEPELENNARRLTDGISAVFGNRWSAEGYPQSATIDLQSVYTLDQTALYPLAGRAYQYTVEVSTDGKTFTRVVDRRSSTRGGSRLADSFSGVGRYLRLTVTGSSGWYTGSWISINEIEVFGKPTAASSRQMASSPPPDKSRPVPDSLLGAEEIVAYPNPIIVDEIRFDRAASGALLDIHGKTVTTFEQVTRLDASGLLKGMYLLRFRSGQSIKLLK